MSARIPELWRGPSVRPSLSDLKQFRDRPQSFLLDLVREYGDIVWFGAGRWRLVVGARPDHVHHVLVEGRRVYTKATFQYQLLSEITGDGLLTSDGDLWRERRRLQQPAFHRARLGLVSSATFRATERLWQRWSKANLGPVDVALEMFRLSLDVVLDVLFGMAPDDRSPVIVEATMGVLDHLIHRSRSIPGMPSWASPVKHRRYRSSLAILDDEIARILDKRRTGLTTDDRDKNLLDLLIAGENNEVITAAGVRNEMITMIIAGHETVASALTWAWSLVADRPDIEDRLASEAASPERASGAQAVETLGTARNVISEALRLYPPAWLVSRRSDADNDSDRWLPKGTMVLLSPYVTHRMPDLWPEPDQFDPDRFESAPAPGSYFPFGMGPRQCIGNDFALVEAVIVLSDISRRCRLRPVFPSASEYAGVTLQREGGLLATVQPR